MISLEREIRNKMYFVSYVPNASWGVITNFRTEGQAWDFIYKFLMCPDCEYTCWKEFWGEIDPTDPENHEVVMCDAEFWVENMRDLEPKEYLDAGGEIITWQEYFNQNPTKYGVPKTMVKLGDKVKDKFNGFEGIAYGICDYLTGCKQVLVRPMALDKDGKLCDSHWFDIDILELVKEEAKLPLTVSGGPQTNEAPTK
jgi:hypothetical protein